MALTEDEESMVRAIIAIYKTQAPSLSTDVAIRAAALFAAWDSNGRAYAEGERVSYEGELYTCLQAHTVADRLGTHGSAEPLGAGA